MHICECIYTFYLSVLYSCFVYLYLPEIYLLNLKQYFVIAACELVCYFNKKQYVDYSIVIKDVSVKLNGSLFILCALFMSGYFQRFKLNRLPVVDFAVAISLDELVLVPVESFKMLPK